MDYFTLFINVPKHLLMYFRDVINMFPRVHTPD